MNKILYIFLIIVSTSFYSCTNIALNLMGVTQSDSEYYLLTNGQKTVAYIPMHHVGTESFYESVADDVDSFQKSGYVVYYEGVGKTGIDSVETMILKRKLRKLVGLNIEQYYDSTTRTLGGTIEYKGKKNLMNQPSYPDLNVNMETALNVDLPIHELIKEYEESRGEIILDTCDITTDLHEPYNCKGLPILERRKFLTEFVIDLRDEHISNTIINNAHDKILIIYGKKHFKGVKRKLQKHDPFWQEIKP